MESILNVKVSWFNNYKETVPAGETTLIRWLQGTKLKEKVNSIRQQPDKSERDAIKATLPACTPSGIFTQRNASGLIRHSGFICLDVDLKGNQQITNYAQLKQQLSKIKQVAYCGQSVSATGYFVLIPIAFPDKHLEHFYALQMAFKNLGITIDEVCKDVCRLRGFSFNEDAYFNHNAVPFTGLYTPAKRQALPKPTSDTSLIVDGLLCEIERSKTDITEGYNNWFAIGCNFAATFGEAGRNYFHRVSKFFPGYQISSCDRKFDDCLKKVIGLPADLGAFINRCKDYGFTTTSRQPGKSEVVPLSTSMIVLDVHNFNEWFRMISAINENLLRRICIEKKDQNGYRVYFKHDNIDHKIPIASREVHIPDYGLIHNDEQDISFITQDEFELLTSTASLVK